ncbi:hypothetical protein [Rhodococcus sp. NPDC060176]|uniref:hypothetical protein n=1 Tax=Rhodococcus sp. NPDC060176 TaxID=3347062 RepID=UPI0036609DE9
MDYPFEGDLSAVVEAVAIPRVFRESMAQLMDVFRIPDMTAQMDEILADAWWAYRMAGRG